jgi:predicted transcriptional regulator
MGDFDLNYEFMEETDELANIDWDILEQLFNPETDLSCDEVLHDISATTSQNDAVEEMKEAFRVEQKENFALPIIQKTKRFGNVSDKELRDLEDRKQSKSTKSNTKWGLKLFQGMYYRPTVQIFNHD